MGLYHRTKKRKDGTVRKSPIWSMDYMLDGKQRCESTKTTNKRVAQRILDLRIAEIIEGRFRLPKSNAPRFEQFSQEFLDSVRHEVTRRRYTSAVVNHRAHFGDVRLSDITAERIEQFKDARLRAKVRAATVNRDLAVLFQMLKIAERKRLIRSAPIREVEMLEERKERRQPHILTFNEEEKLLATAADHIRVLTILILETGLRSGKEALALKWVDIDFLNESIRVRQSKTVAGQRIVPMSNRCRAELLRWQEVLGSNFSEYVFPKPWHPETHLRDVRAAWANALSAAGLEHFWIYDLRHTFASRVTQAGVSHIFVAQMMGHSSSSGILQTYVKAIDEYKRSAISKLEALREAHSIQSTRAQLVQ
jgi:integrase